MTTPSPAETQAAVKRLHENFCTLTGRMERLRFYERAWFELLRCEDYRYNAELLWKDVQHVVRYLRLGIRDGKRNEGALKLANFLAEDKFFADLAEARAVLKPQRSRVARPHTPAPGEAPAPVEATQEIAAKLRQFKEAL